MDARGSDECMAVADGPADWVRGADRRKRHPWLADAKYAFVGRRRHIRRVSDRSSSASIVDWYPTSLLVLALTVVTLSACDAALTLVILDRGITTEANPFMQLLLDQGVPVFVGFKMLLTGLGIVLMVAYSQVKALGRLSMHRALSCLALFYVALIGYELILLSR